MPAAKATKKLTSAILLFEQFFEHFSSGGTVPFRRTPTAGESFSLGTNQISGGKSPSAVQLSDFSFGIEGNRIGKFELFDEGHCLLLAVFNVHGQDHEVVIF